MKINISLTFLLLHVGASVWAQYSPELDVRGTDDTDDGGELQLATPSETNFLRFFSGRLGDPKPFIYFSNSDALNIANGAADFSNFKERLTILPNGNLGINTIIPQSIFHFHGDLTTKWDVTFRHYELGWDFHNQIYFNKSWSSDLYDFLYLGATGARDNALQSALLLSRKEGVLFGKGHNDGNQLSEVHLQIDTLGIVHISELAGKGTRPLYVNEDGAITVSSDTCYYSIHASAFHPDDSVLHYDWTANWEEAHFIESTANCCLIAPINIPDKATITEARVYFTDTDAANDAGFTIGYRMADPVNQVLQSIGRTNTGGSVSSDSLGGGISIDNKDRAYYVSMCRELPGMQLTDQLRVHQIQFAYLR